MRFAAFLFVVVCSGALLGCSNSSSPSDRSGSYHFSSDEERLEWRSKNKLPMTDEDVKYEQRKIIEQDMKRRASERSVGR